MGSLKHTPGTWEVGGPWPTVTVVHCVDGGSGFPDPEPPIYEPICYTHQSCGDFKTPPPDTAIADARLISAAPEMLKALKIIPAEKLELLAQWLDLQDQPDEWQCDLRNMAALSKKAIDKINKIEL